MRVTGYDRVSSLMISIVLGLIVGVVAVIAWWSTTRPPQQEILVPLEMVELSGGSEDGAPDETLQVESPEDPNPNPSPTEELLDENELTETLENVVELADRANQQLQQQQSNAAETSGTPGSAAGTGRRALGSGPGSGGIPREQRWFIRYADRVSSDEYARQLDFFKIELGVLQPTGQLVYVSNVSQPKPTTRVSKSGAGEKRLYMTWQSGERRVADEALFKKAGVNVAGGILFHFYPADTERLLATLEQRYANRKPDEIRRTYFVVVKKGRGYDFVVTRQTYIQ